MRVFVAVLLLVIVVALAINVAGRIPSDTVAMGIGVVIGAFAAVPVSLVMGLVFTRRSATPVAPVEEPALPVATHPPYPRVDAYTRVSDYPPVVIINPSAFQQHGQSAYAPARLEAGPLASGPRQFTVVGEEATQ
jgi:hypothetical protein